MGCRPGNRVGRANGDGRRSMPFWWQSGAKQLSHCDIALVCFLDGGIVLPRRGGRVLIFCVPNNSRDTADQVSPGGTGQYLLNIPV